MDTFEYGIGVLIDEATSGFELSELQKAGYSIWDVKQKQIMKSILKKEKIICSVCALLVEDLFTFSNEYANMVSED